MPSQPVYRFRIGPSNLGDGADPRGPAMRPARSFGGNIARLRIGFRILAACLSTAGIFTGCGSLERSNLFATGRDARTFNPQTGRYEWPDDEPARSPSTRRASPPPERKDAAPDDGRAFNPQTGRFERADE